MKREAIVMQALLTCCRIAVVNVCNDGKISDPGLW